MPATRPEFWRHKIEGNIARDRAALAALHAGGWRVMVIWECALRGKARLEDQEFLENAAGFIRDTSGTLNVIEARRLA